MVFSFKSIDCGMMMEAHDAPRTGSVVGVSGQRSIGGSVLHDGDDVPLLPLEFIVGVADVPGGVTPTTNVWSAVGLAAAAVSASIASPTNTMQIDATLQDVQKKAMQVERACALSEDLALAQRRLGIGSMPDTDTLNTIVANVQRTELAMQILHRKADFTGPTLRKDRLRNLMHHRGHCASLAFFPWLDIVATHHHVYALRDMAAEDLPLVDARAIVTAMVVSDAYHELLTGGTGEPLLGWTPFHAHGGPDYQKFTHVLFSMQEDVRLLAACVLRSPALCADRELEALEAAHKSWAALVEFRTWKAGADAGAGTGEDTAAGVGAGEHTAAGEHSRHAPVRTQPQPRPRPPAPAPSLADLT